MATTATERVLVVCQVCGKPYAARWVDGDPIVSTDSGSCSCGGSRFAVPEHAQE